MRRRRRPLITWVLSLAGAGISAVMLLLIPAPVAAQESVTVKPRAEAWYRTVSTAPEGGVPSACDLPTGCGPGVPKPPVSPPSAYPSGTLHVGAAAGTEEARTYVTLDMSKVPAGEKLTGGTLRLPLASDPNSGTVAPELAKVRVCDVPTFVRDGADGELTGAPKVDCRVFSPGTFVEGKGEQPGEFLVDLTPFAGAWSSGGATLAVLPDKGLAPSDSWHLTFSRHDRDADGAVPITAQLLFGEERLPSLGKLPPLPNSGNDSPPPPNNSFPAPAVGANPPVAADPPPVAQTSTALDANAAGAEAPLAPVTAEAGGLATTPTQPVTAVSVAHAYPAVFLLPLVLGLSIAWTGRAFTCDLRPAGA